MIEFLTQPWTWWFSGVMIVSIMFFLLYFGQSFGFSSNLKTICSAVGLGKKVAFFDFNWKTEIWNLLFLIGAMIGGFIAHQYLSSGTAVIISEATIKDLATIGIAAPIAAQPMELFSLEALFTLKGFLILALGGFMVGFGSRYAGGCTSGHAISGLSNLQLPSLLAVVGFFAGGLIMTHFLLPLFLKL
jgi:uncharacterized membrane protein YedE/YeeE